MSPAEAREPGEVAVGRDELGARFDGQGGMVGVRHQIAARTRRDAEPPKRRPMTIAWRDDDHVGMRTQRIDRIERNGGRRWACEDARIGDDPDETTQHEFREAEWLAAQQGALQPCSISKVLGRSVVQGMDDDIHV